MPFCPTCGFEYREGATRCSTCGARLIAEPLRSAGPHVGFAPADIIAGWLARQRPFWNAWVRTAGEDLRSFPRFFLRGVGVVFRHPLLYLLPLALFIANQYMVYRYTEVLQARGYSDAMPFSREQPAESLREAISRRLSTLPTFFGKAVFQVRVGSISDPLPAIPLPYPDWVRQAHPELPRWFTGLPVQAAYWVFLALSTALFDAGMYARLKFLVMGEQPPGFISGMERYFWRMAGRVALGLALLLALIYSFRLPLGAFLIPVETLWRVIGAVLFMFASYAVVVDGVHVHRAVVASARFVFAHLPAVIALLAGITFVQAVIFATFAPERLQGPVTTTFVLRQAPSALLLMLFGFCIWGMVMQWYVAAGRLARAERSTV